MWEKKGNPKKVGVKKSGGKKSGGKKIGKNHNKEQILTRIWSTRILSTF